MVRRSSRKRRSTAESSRASNEISALYEVAKDFLEIEDLSALKQQIVISSLGVLGARAGALLEFDAHQNTLSVAVNLGKKAGARSTASFPLRKKWQDFLLKRKEGMPLDFSRGGKKADLEQFNRGNPALIRAAQPSILVPICEDDKLWGLLCLQERLLDGEYSVEDFNLLASLSTLAAKAWGKLASVERRERGKSPNSYEPTLSRLTLAEVKRELALLRKERPALKEIVGESRAILSVFKRILEVARTKCPVLILGQTGTGKELAARAVHRLSSRSDNPFVELNCASVPSELIESELFGYERGAFTGATRERKGVFEQADSGTLFLDEIGDMSLNLQTKLLRVIQEGRFRRLGGEKNIEVDVRIVAASNKDLMREAKKGNFREDLLYRINVYPISLVPLDERSEDIPLLAEHFLGQTVAEFGLMRKTFSSDALRILRDCRFPGNVRELKNIVERVALGSGEEPVVDGFCVVEELEGQARGNLRSFEEYSDEELSAAHSESSDQEDLPLVFEAEIEQDGDEAGGSESKLTLNEIEKSHILRILTKVDNNKTRAAKTLGIPRSTLIGKMKKLGIF